jgi:hypothetical protein
MIKLKRAANFRLTFEFDRDAIELIVKIKISIKDLIKPIEN